MTTSKINSKNNTTVYEAVVWVKNLLQETAEDSNWNSTLERAWNVIHDSAGVSIGIRAVFAAVLSTGAVRCHGREYEFMLPATRDAIEAFRICKGLLSKKRPIRMLSYEEGPWNPALGRFEDRIVRIF